MSNSANCVDELQLQDMFPQFSRKMILDVVDQAGAENAMDFLLELCADSTRDATVDSFWSKSSTESWSSVSEGGPVTGVSKALTGLERGASRSRGWWSAWPQEQEGVLVSVLRKFTGGEVGHSSDAGRTSAEGDGSDAWSEELPSSSPSSVALTPARSDADDARLDGEDKSEFVSASSDYEELGNGKGNVAPLPDDFVEARVGWDCVAEGPLNLFNWSIASDAGRSASANSGTEYWSPGSETSSASGGDNDPDTRNYRFLATMFGDYNIGDDDLRDVLASVGGDVDSAVDVLLKRTQAIEHGPVQAQPDSDHAAKSSDLHDREFPALGEARSVYTAGRSVPSGRKIWGDAAARLNGKSRPVGAEGTPPSGQRRIEPDKSGPQDSSLHRKARALRQQFGNVCKEECLVDLLRDVGGDTDVATALIRGSGLQYMEVSQPPKSRSSASPAKQTPPPAPPPPAPRARTSQIADDVPQAPPPGTVGMPQEEFEALYDSQRRKATELAVLKDMAFKQAMEAYSKGHKDLARKLKLQGKDYSRQARLEHRRAAEAIFEERNSTIVNTFLADLHGMHVDEALERVHQYLIEFNKIQLDKLPSKKIIRFVTGRGKHSPDNVSRLSAALSHFFHQHGVHYSNGYGYFDVSLENANLASLNH